MKKVTLSLIVILLLTALFTGCDTPAAAEPQIPEAPVTVETAAPTEIPTEAPVEATTETVPENTEEDNLTEGDPFSRYTDEVYSEQISRYYTALSEKWDEGKYFENNMSALPAYYYEGNPLENVGFDFVDLDNDGSWELVIGAILNAEQDPAVFEIWTLVDGEPVMLAQGGSRNRYILQYVEEDGMWYVVNEGSNGAANNATYYLMLSEGKFEVTQGIVFDAFADEENPWFMAYDLDWDTSNDNPIVEETATAILESNRKYYTALKYFPYAFYR